MTIRLNDSQDHMPQDTVTVSDPTVTEIHPVPDDSNSQESSKATVDAEPSILRKHKDEEVADYDKGFAYGQSGQNDDTKSQVWQRGWAEAQE